ncbi:Por secretion system C-terminal sorting domain-containing protein [Chitinophaga rupis]|uniref:Por secretion system C-terminal sorting domain-containing protein n=1 Tax=Chitinophaga rupis TaxID=573321 RepID=A0A1H7ZNB0_9BACT|nr:beta-1,3-glucanase family protein [Chitinophaga rupis]SEM58937.1 Por secretion system C-terminal sorting domain-containing protein [Chitinophaga rupis]
MKTRSLSGSLCARAALLFIVVILTGSKVQAQTTVPFTLYNNSAYADGNVYVAVVGIINDNHVWIDPKTGAVNLMNVSNNTVPGPVINGNQGPGGNGRYANCFAKLSEIPNKVINIPGIAGCRILISFNSQLYLYFFGASGSPSGYAAPNLANPTDPNQGIRFETIELTNASNGLWVNTTRVDSYQYPMGLEVWGNGGFYQKVGELLPHSQILSQWQSTAPADFAGCYDAANGIIKFPSKTAAFQSGAQANYFGSYIDAIWSKYQNGNLVFNAGDAGTWSGRVSGNVFTFTRTSDGQVGTISRKPTNLEAMEGSGVMATGGQWDKVVQAQICAAINRHAIDLTLATGATQDFSSASKYYQTSPYNWYCKFWHRSDISLNSLTYAFCYDDVFNHSSTINATSPLRTTITIGGFSGITASGAAIAYKDCNYTGYAVGLSPGTYTLSQLNALGILNDDISSIKVTSGYKVTLYKHDNFGGSTLVLTADDNCLVDNNMNDSTSSLKIESNTNTSSIVVQAEDYNYMSGVATEATTDAGGGLDVGWIEAGDWMSYNVTIPATGTYRVDYRVASPNANTTLRLEKDAGATQLGTVTIPNTGGWQNWGNVSHTVTLPAGTYSIGIATATGGFNLNYLTITGVASAARMAVQTVKTEDGNTAVTLSPNPVTEQLHLRNNDKVRALSIYDISGHQVMKVKSPGNTISVSSLTPGVYIITIDRKDGVQKQVKILKQ